MLFIKILESTILSTIESKTGTIDRIYACLTLIYKAHKYYLFQIIFLQLNLNT